MNVIGERISITTVDGTAEAYLARPEGHGRRPGVLLYMDAIGLRPQIEQMAERIAGWGFVLLAPNVFYRSASAAEIAPKVDLRLPGAREAFFPTVTPLIEAHTPDQAAADFKSYLGLLTESHYVDDRPIGITGYCMGGRLALRAAAQKPAAVAAIGMFHTGGLVTDDADSPHTLIPSITAEVLAGYADQDPSMTAEQITIVGRLLDHHGVTHASTTYVSAPHGYTMADTSMYHPPAAEWHFRELRQLLVRTLH